MTDKASRSAVEIITMLWPKLSERDKREVLDFMTADVRETRVPTVSFEEIADNLAHQAMDRIRAHAGSIEAAVERDGTKVTVDQVLRICMEGDDT